MTSWRLEVTSWRLEMTFRRLEVTFRRLEVTFRRLEVTSWRLEVTSWRLEISFRKQKWVNLGSKEGLVVLIATGRFLSGATTICVYTQRMLN